jgi:hypothetical protein
MWGRVSMGRVVGGMEGNAGEGYCAREHTHTPHKTANPTHPTTAQRTHHNDGCAGIIRRRRHPAVLRGPPVRCSVTNVAYVLRKRCVDGLPVCMCVLIFDRLHTSTNHTNIRKIGESEYRDRMMVEVRNGPPTTMKPQPTTAAARQSTACACRPISQPALRRAD